MPSPYLATTTTTTMACCDSSLSCWVRYLPSIEGQGRHHLHTLWLPSKHGLHWYLTNTHGTHGIPLLLRTASHPHHARNPTPITHGIPLPSRTAFYSLWPWPPSNNGTRWIALVPGTCCSRRTRSLARRSAREDGGVSAADIVHGGALYTVGSQLHT